VGIVNWILNWILIINHQYRMEYFKRTPFYEVAILNWLTAYMNFPVNYQDAIKDFKNSIINSYNEFEKKHIYRRLQ
ncbi:1529_t:CDS:1, partial [Racocetra persica]